MTPPKTDRNCEIHHLYKKMKDIPDKRKRMEFLFNNILIPHGISERRMYYIVKWVEKQEN